MKIRIELSREDLLRLVLEEIRRATGNHQLEQDSVSIQTKSKQNYKSEWETADFRAVFEADIADR